MSAASWIRPCLVAGLTLALAGCFFETRDPEEGSAEVCYESIASKEVDFVFANLDGSLACLQSSSYEDQLGDDFEFQASPDAIAQYPNAFEGTWDKARESEFLSLLFSQAQSIESDLRESTIEESGTDRVLVEANYRLSYTDSGGGAIVYSGVAFYTLEQRATVWVLVEWQDSGGDNPISLLKGEIFQGGG